MRYGNPRSIVAATRSFCRSAARIGAVLPEIAIPLDHTVLGADMTSRPAPIPKCRSLQAGGERGQPPARGASGQLLSHARSPDGGMTGSALVQSPPTGSGASATRNRLPAGIALGYVGVVTNRIGAVITPS
jgi:hypothetical protein